MATLKDVANKAGFSISTVSYVLNGKKRVKQETYNKIMQAVEEVGYIPNQLARSLKTKHTLSIGVIVPDISNPFFPEIVKGIDDTATENGYSIILCNTENDVSREERCINTLLGKDIDGIIFIGAAKSKIDLKSKTNLPVVLVDRNRGDRFMSVSSDNYQGGYMATEHLINKGHQSIALFTGSSLIQTFADRIRGYIAALENNNIPYDEDLVYESEFTTEDGYNSTYKLFRERDNVTAIFAANDLLAFGAIRGSLEHNKKIPQDVAIIGFDDIYLSAIIMPALTTIKQPKYEMGEKAAELLIKRIEEGASPNVIIKLPPSLIVRETT